MNPIVRNILAVIAGALVGGAVNMGIIMIGGSIIPPPVGVDVNDVVSINAHINEYSFAQMMVPFLAHAIGTLVGAWLAVRLAVSRHMLLAVIVGMLFLAGGYMAVRMIPNAPLWFDALDLIVAYLPMAWLGWRMAKLRT